MGKSSGSSQREVTPEERRLWDAQKNNLDSLTKIAEEQYNLSAEDRSYYEKVFREGSDTEAKSALAKLKSQITGTTVNAEDIKDVSIDSLLRDTILNSTPEFQEAANKVVESNNTLTQKYGADVTGLSKSFSDSLNQYTTNYQQELQTAKGQMGTANEDVLSRVQGSAQAGISSSYQEARKQLESTLARKGLSGSGVEANILSQNYQQEALAKSQAAVQARTQAIQESDAIRQQQLALAGQSYQAGVSGLQTGYNANLGAIQNVYGVTTANDLQNYQLRNAATLQGISGLTQVAQAGQGLYAGSQNYLAQAGASSGQAASIAGSSASSLASVNSQYELAQQQQKAQGLAGIGSLVGTLGGAAFMGAGSAGGFGNLFSLATKK